MRRQPASLSRVSINPLFNHHISQRMMLPLTISQTDYINYKHAIEDVRTVYKSYQKDQTGQLGLKDGRLVKSLSDTGSSHFLQTLYYLLRGYTQREEWRSSLNTADKLGIKQRIQLINQLHGKLEGPATHPQDCRLLAADLYSSSFKTMQAWNALFKLPGEAEWTIRTFEAASLRAIHQPIHRDVLYQTDDDKALSQLRTLS